MGGTWMKMVGEAPLGTQLTGIGWCLEVVSWWSLVVTKVDDWQLAILRIAAAGKSLKNAMLIVRWRWMMLGLKKLQAWSQGVLFLSQERLSCRVEFLMSLGLRKSQSSGAEHHRSWVIEGHITKLHSHNHWSLLGVLLGCFLGLPNMDCQIVYGLLRCSFLEIQWNPYALNTQSMRTSIGGINA